MKNRRVISKLIDLSILVVIINGCVVPPTPAPALAPPLPTSSPTTELAATETATPTMVPPKINPRPESFPVGTTVEESFKNGDYELGMQKIAIWAGEWAGQKILISSSNSLNPVPLDLRPAGLPELAHFII
jgi:hypothetical protein